MSEWVRAVSSSKPEQAKLAGQSPRGPAVFGIGSKPPVARKETPAEYKKRTEDKQKQMLLKKLEKERHDASLTSRAQVSEGVPQAPKEVDEWVTVDAAKKKKEKQSPAAPTASPAPFQISESRKPWSEDSIPAVVYPKFFSTPEKKEQFIDDIKTALLRENITLKPGFTVKVHNVLKQVDLPACSLLSFFLRVKHSPTVRFGDSALGK